MEFPETGKLQKCHALERPRKRLYLRTKGIGSTAWGLTAKPKRRGVI